MRINPSTLYHQFLLTICLMLLVSCIPSAKTFTPTLDIIQAPPTSLPPQPTNTLTQQTFPTRRPTKTPTPTRAFSATPTFIKQTDLAPSATQPPTIAAFLQPSWCLVTPTPYPETKHTIRTAFVVNRQDGSNLWLWDEGSQPVQLTNFGDVDELSISDDGNSIVFTRVVSPSQQSMWAIQADGENVRPLIAASDLSQMATKPEAKLWLMQAQWLAGQQEVVVRLVYPTEKDDDIWKINLSTGDHLFLGKGGYNVSPDGQYLVVYNAQGIDLYDAQGNLVRTKILPDYRVITEEEKYIYLTNSWASDSQSLLIALPETNNVYQSGANFSIRRVWVDDKPLENLGTYTGFASSVHFSPDHLFMFYDKSADVHPSELHLVNLQTKEDILFLRDDFINFGGWSPNSYAFIYHVVYDIYIGNLCLSPQATIKLPYNNSFTLPWWVDSTTLLISERSENWRLHFEHLGIPPAQNFIVLADKYQVVLVKTP